MPATLDDIAAMVTFARVVRTRSFSTAARELDLSKSAVSKRVAALEERLGLRLLNRTTRKLATTEAGELFYERCLRILEEAESAMDTAAAQHEEPHGILRVNGPVWFGQMHLSPLVPPLLQVYPRLTIELTLTDQFIDPIEERQDITVRIARLADSSLVARKLGEDRRVVVASPTYLARHGSPRAPVDLLDHECLRFARISLRDEWRFLRAPVPPGSGPTPREDEMSVAVRGRLTTDSGKALIDAALAGVGLAMLPTFMIAPNLRSGELVPLLEDWIPRGHGIYALHGHHRHVPPKVRVFLDALGERLKKGA